MVDTVHEYTFKFKCSVHEFLLLANSEIVSVTRVNTLIDDLTRKRYKNTVCIKILSVGPATIF